jgi:hypothetical protein
MTRASADHSIYIQEELDAESMVVYSHDGGGGTTVCRTGKIFHQGGRGKARRFEK